ncbi:hypothetical protein L202_00923 [Cryptococcus amylolentus CBS 6039]|uniref:Uncharacterized protein n=1 Tax=Cryptococcus amylolentus CBS 6039 TaxID=1295533 RepID=A0A1E3I900_9TREE|nr:hypothetical protein L202_00923 [Cryptococcus amylolentus CBS 6039]ODN85100.1 hypothetical protein L202_00923 [Cryptococcus amylolentus CBS 6039]
MSEVVYNNDTRYPGPLSYTAPPEVTGLPTQAELDAYPRMFTWGELKEIIRSGDLGQLMRNKEMQWKYDQWSAGMKAKFGSTEKYLTNTRLPFPKQSSDPIGLAAHTARLNLSTPSVSGTSTPRSVGFASLDSRGEEEPEYLKWTGELDPEKYAVLPNDWPYCVPYGVRHFCVWSRIPIGHPHLVDYDPEAWAIIEDQGLGGFTGVAPVTFPATPPEFTSLQVPPSSTADSLPAALGRGAVDGAGDRLTSDWYNTDVLHGGKELRRWAGVKYESRGGEEVGRMVRGLWDERGWECLFFVNPPRLQSVPGFSHFHVFARRKTPEEIDAAEKIWEGAL